MKDYHCFPDYDTRILKTKYRQNIMLSPQLTIGFLKRKIYAFHFFGVLGYLAGSSLGMCLGYFLWLSISIILLMSLLGAATFFALAILAKIFTGGETIVYYHHEIAILIMCSVVLKLLHLPVLQYLDITIIGIATFLSFGRMGCFSVGCCHGKPSKGGVIYGREYVKAGFYLLLRRRSAFSDSVGRINYCVLYYPCRFVPFAKAFRSRYCFNTIYRTVRLLPFCDRIFQGRCRKTLLERIIRGTVDYPAFSNAESRF